jgi:hypothetical protein
VADQTVSDKKSIAHRIQRAPISDSDLRGGHELDRCLAQDRLLAGGEDPRPFDEVPQRGDQASIRRGHGKHRDAIGSMFSQRFAPSKAFGLIMRRNMSNTMDTRRAHLHGIEDVVLDVVFVRSIRLVLDDDAEQRVAEIRV